MGFHLSTPPPHITKKRTRPDFLVSDTRGKPLCVIECTSDCLPKEALSCNRRLNNLLLAIGKSRSPNFFLDIVHDGTLNNPAPGAKIRKELERWMAALDPDDLMQKIVSSGLDDLPKYSWKSDDFILTITPIPKNPDRRNFGLGTAIGALSPREMSEVKTSVGIKKALMNKGYYYGNLDLPFIIAINVIGNEFARREHCLEAFFGQECVSVSRTKDGSIQQRHERRPNGAWSGPAGFRMKGVSGAMIAFGLSAFTIHKQGPILYHHPCPSNPFSFDLWPLDQYVVRENRMVKLEGRPASDLLGLSPLPVD